MSMKGRAFTPWGKKKAAINAEIRRRKKREQDARRDPLEPPSLADWLATTTTNWETSNGQHGRPFLFC